MTHGLASEKQINTWLKRAAQAKQSLFQLITQHRLVTADEFAKACATHCHIPFDENFDLISIKNIYSNSKLNAHLKKIPALLAIHDDALILFICNPLDLNLKAKLELQSGKRIIIKLAPYNALINLHNQYATQLYIDQLNENKPLEASELIQNILSSAIHLNASDIHIETYANQNRIRFRIDGLLEHKLSISNKLMHKVINCIKVLSKLDISIKQQPQDGRLTVLSHLGFNKQARINTYPTQFGEKVVLRLLDSETQLRQISSLGLDESAERLIKKVIQQPQGLILVTGPTGSGKSMTLYTLLKMLNNTQRNISTIEDPIEIPIEGINQSSVNDKNGFTFSTALRALLRQDPDVIMVGEIRDLDTAQMAVRAAQTGHLVLATLHANNTRETFARLMNMGIPAFQLYQVITLIIAQRLMRKLCDHCKTIMAISDRVLIKAGVPIDREYVFYEPSDCHHCTNGYNGRVGVFELLPVMQNSALFSEDACNTSFPTPEITLRKAALSHVYAGQTSLSEVFRVIQNE